MCVKSFTSTAGFQDCKIYKKKQLPPWFITTRCHQIHHSRSFMKYFIKVFHFVVYPILTDCWFIWALLQSYILSQSVWLQAPKRRFWLKFWQPGAALRGSLSVEPIRKPPAEWDKRVPDYFPAVLSKSGCVVCVHQLLFEQLSCVPVAADSTGGHKRGHPWKLWSAAGGSDHSPCVVWQPWSDAGHEGNCLDRDVFTLNLAVQNDY